MPSSQQFAAGGEDDGGDGGEEEHLFIDEILNVWQHIQNGEHKEDEENSNALHTLPQFHSSFMGQIKNWYQKPCHNPSQDASFAVLYTSSQVFHTSTNKSFAFY